MRGIGAGPNPYAIFFSVQRRAKSGGGGPGGGVGRRRSKSGSQLIFSSPRRTKQAGTGSTTGKQGEDRRFM